MWFLADDVFSLLGDWLVARSRAWETNQELFELTKRARSRLGGSDAGGQRALGIFPVEVVFQKHICGVVKDCSVCSALREGRFYSAVQDSLDRLDHFRAGVWVDSVSFARYSDVRLSRVSGDVKLFYVYPYQVLVHAPLSTKPFPTLKVPVHTSFGIAEVKQIQAVNPKFGVDNVILTPESVTQLTDEEAAHVFDDYASGVDVGWAVPMEGGYLTIPTPKYMSEHFPALKAANVPFENLTYNNLIGDYTIGWVRSIQRPTAHAKVGYDVIIGDYRFDSDRPHWVDDTFMHAYLWKSPEHKVLQKGEFIDANLKSRKEYSEYADAKDVYEYIKTNEEIFEEIQRRSGYQILCPVYPDYSHGFSVDTYTDSMPVILRRAGTAGQPRQNGAFIEMVNFGASPKAETITIKLS